MFALNGGSGPRISLHYLLELNHPGFTYYARLQKLKDYVEQHVQEPISTVDAAGVAALEVKYRAKVSFSAESGPAVAFTVRHLITERDRLSSRQTFMVLQ